MNLKVNFLSSELRVAIIGTKFFIAIISIIGDKFGSIIEVFFVGDRPEVPANVYSKIYIIRIIYSKSKLTQD